MKKEKRKGDKIGKKRKSLSVGDSCATRKIVEKIQGMEKEIVKYKNINQVLSCKGLKKRELVNSVEVG